jgi:hypothetical protein
VLHAPHVFVSKSQHEPEPYVRTQSESAEQQAMVSDELLVAMVGRR